jgi:hypothetical protein
MKKEIKKETDIKEAWKNNFEGKEK